MKKATRTVLFLGAGAVAIGGITTAIILSRRRAAPELPGADEVPADEEPVIEEPIEEEPQEPVVVAPPPEEPITPPVRPAPIDVRPPPTPAPIEQEPDEVPISPGEDEEALQPIAPPFFPPRSDTPDVIIPPIIPGPPVVPRVPVLSPAPAPPINLPIPPPPVVVVPPIGSIPTPPVVVTPAPVRPPPVFVPTPTVPPRVPVSRPAPSPPPSANLPPEGTISDLDPVTAAMLEVLLEREKRADWKQKEQVVKDWQKARRRTQDMMFGPGDAKALALETGLLPIVRFWPRGSLIETGALDKFRDELEAIAANAEEPRRTELLAAIDREQGQGFDDSDQAPIRPLIILEDAEEIAS